MLSTLAWLALVLVHMPPALATFSPALRRRMYGVDANPQLNVILTHRGVLFLAVAAVCAYAAFTPQARRTASIVAAISVVGFLLIYASARFPKGPAAVHRADGCRRARSFGWRCRGRLDLDT